MKRLTWISCLLVATMLPGSGRAKTEGISLQDYERPVSYRLAINAVVGDLSYLQRFGELPVPGTDPDLRVRTHLDFVHDLLSRRDVSGIPEDLRRARMRSLSHLREYIDAGVFPRNDRYLEQSRPCFIDAEGRICAVGYLVECSVGREAAEQINEAFQWEFLWRMKMPVIDRWAAESGFSMLELSMIQPTYGPKFYGTHVLDSPRAPATLTIDGTIRDTDCFCDTERVTLYFGDGSSWESGMVNEFFVPIEIQHVYSCPGTYRVVWFAFAADTCRCGGDAWGFGEFSHDIVVEEPVFALQALRESGGAVYLSTLQDIRLEHIDSATIDWGDGSPPEPASWTADGDLFRTQPHAYATTGSFMVSVTNNYEGLCSFTQQSLVQIAPGVPTVQASWGYLKAKYEAGG